jgi:hypothetical protein
LSTKFKKAKIKISKNLVVPSELALELANEVVEEVHGVGDVLVPGLARVRVLGAGDEVDQGLEEEQRLPDPVRLRKKYRFFIDYFTMFRDLDFCNFPFSLNFLHYLLLIS